MLGVIFSSLYNHAGAAENFTGWHFRLVGTNENAEITNFSQQCLNSSATLHSNFLALTTDEESGVLKLVTTLDFRMQKYLPRTLLLHFLIH